MAFCFKTGKSVGLHTNHLQIYKNKCKKRDYALIIRHFLPEQRENRCFIINFVAKNYDHNV